MAPGARPSRTGRAVSRPSSAERLGRLLAVVPWVMAQDGPTLAEVCRRFAVSEGDLLADLKMLFLCGVYPFTPDALIEVDIDDGRVWIRFAEWFRRPLRLTPPEGLALVAAARAVLDVPGRSDGPLVPGAPPRRDALESALAKLETVLGGGGEDGIDVALGKAPPGVLATLQEAAALRRLVRLEYYSFGRDQLGERTVRPWRVFSSGGHWYLLAWCETAGGKRLFRVDRASSAAMLEGTFEPPDDPGDVAVYEGSAEDPLVVLRLGPQARWVAGHYPNEGTEELADGRLLVKLRASSTAWLERLLLCAGPEAEVVSGPRATARGAARRLLAMYAM